MTSKISQQFYVKPKLVKYDNLKAITFECPNWQCSVTVPPAP